MNFAQPPIKMILSIVPALECVGYIVLSHVWSSPNSKDGIADFSLDQNRVGDYIGGVLACLGKKLRYSLYRLPIVSARQERFHFHDLLGSRGVYRPNAEVQALVQLGKPVLKSVVGGHDLANGIRDKRVLQVDAFLWIIVWVGLQI